MTCSRQHPQSRDKRPQNHGHLRFPVPTLGPLHKAVAAIGAASMVLAACGSSSGGGTATATSHAKDLGVITSGELSVAALNDQVPMDTVNSSGSPVGFAIDLLRKVGTDLGLKVTFTETQGSTLLQGVETGRYDTEAAPLVENAARKKAMAFTLPWYWSPDEMLSLPSAPIGTMQAAEQPGTTIGVLGQSAQQAVLQKQFPGVHFIAYPSQTAELTALSAKQINGVFLGGSNAAAVVAASPHTYHRGAVVPVTEPSAFAVRLGNSKLQTAITTELQKLINDGTFMTIWNKDVPFAPSSIALATYPALRRGLAAHYSQSLT